MCDAGDEMFGGVAVKCLVQFNGWFPSVYAITQVFLEFYLSVLLKSSCMIFVCIACFSLDWTAIFPFILFFFFVVKNNDLNRSKFNAV